MASANGSTREDGSSSTSQGVPQAGSWKPGDVLVARYELLRPIGEGGMGVVWEAKQLTTEKSLAIKLLKSTDRADLARFLREAKLAAGLSHRNIVQVFDFWEVPEQHLAFLVMELLVGESLGARLARAGKLTVDETLATAAPVIRALRAAHDKGVVHRDLKPDNIFFAREEVSADGAHAVELKVVDFGLAKATVVDANLTALTQTESILGTPSYMAPELIYGEKDIDVRADIWALGVVLYECLAGQRPFGGENFGQIFRSISQGNYVPLRELAHDVPAWLEQLISRMLSHDRERRPSLAEASTALDDPLHSAMSTIRMPSLLAMPTQRMASAATLGSSLHAADGRTPMATVLLHSRPPPAPSSRRGLVLGAVVGCLALTGATVVLWPIADPARRSEPRSPAGSLLALPSLESGVVQPPSMPPEEFRETAAAPEPVTTAPVGSADASVSQPNMQPRLFKDSNATRKQTADPLTRGRF